MKSLMSKMNMVELKEKYEAPRVFRLSDGKLYLMMDFYGCERKEDQGYVPCIMESLADVRLNFAKEKFSLPYGFKHGVVLKITDEEYGNILKNI